MVLPEQLACFRYEKLDDQKGYVMTDEVGPCEAVDTSGITERLPMPEFQEECLERLLDYLEENGLQALFILSPTVMEEEKQKMDFSDYGGHVNALGAEKCSTFLGRYLVENYGIEDKRGEKGCESWDAAYLQWQEEFAQAKQTIARRIAEKDFADAPVEEPE